MRGRRQEPLSPHWEAASVATLVNGIVFPILWVGFDATAGISAFVTASLATWAYEATLFSRYKSG